MTKTNIVRNTTYFMAAMTAQKILSFLYFTYVARIIGVENTGKYSFALSFTTIFAMVLDFGLVQVLIRESARRPEDSSRYLANILGLKLVGSVLIYGLVVLMINLLGYPELTKQMVYVSGLVMLIDSFVLSFYGVLRGRHNLKFESLGVVINQFIILILGVLVLWLNLGLVILVGVYLVGSLFNFIYSVAVLKIKFGFLPRVQFHWPTIKNLFWLALPFAVAGIFIRIYSYMDIILLSKLSSDAAVGWYSVAYKITFAFQFIGLAFLASIYPAFSYYFIHSRELLARTFIQSFRYLILISLPLSAGIIALADKLIVPIFGADYYNSIAPLKILMFSLVFVFLCIPTGAMLNACNRQTRNTIHLGITAFVNIILNLILIPRFDYQGAAIAALISYLILFILGMVVVEKIIDYNRWYLLNSFFKSLGSCLIMALAVIYLKNYWHFLPVIFLGVFIYFGFLFLFGGFKIGDLRQVFNLLTKR